MMVFIIPWLYTNLPSTALREDCKEDDRMHKWEDTASGLVLIQMADIRFWIRIIAAEVKLISTGVVPGKYSQAMYYFSICEDVKNSKKVTRI